MINIWYAKSCQTVNILFSLLYKMRNTTQNVQYRINSFWWSVYQMYLYLSSLWYSFTVIFIIIIFWFTLEIVTYVTLWLVSDWMVNGVSLHTICTVSAMDHSVYYRLDSLVISKIIFTNWTHMANIFHCIDAQRN